MVNIDWLIRSTKQLEFHTNLNKLFKGGWINIENYNWFLSDIDYITSIKDGFPLNLQDEYFILTSDDFKIVAESDTQVIWGTISAIPKHLDPEYDIENLPFVEGNDNVWQNGKLQIKNSMLEIIAFDSGYTILKFKDPVMSEKFKGAFNEAIPLEKYK